MELKLRNGQYCLSEGGLETVQGREEVLQRVLMRLAAHRGTFLPDPDYGSRLYQLGRLKPAQRSAAARLYVEEALEDEPDVYVRSVAYLPGEDGEAAVVVAFAINDWETEITIRV